MRLRVFVMVGVVSTLLLSACAAAPARPTATAVVTARSGEPSDLAGLVTLSGCPQAPGAVRDSGVQGAAVLLLPFSPARLWLCRYGGLNSRHSQQLVASRELMSATDISTLVAAVNSQSARRLRTASCPADFGTITNLYAQDARTSRWLTLRIVRTGCRSISNGSIRNALESNAIERILKKDVGAPGR